MNKGINEVNQDLKENTAINPSFYNQTKWFKGYNSESDMHLFLKGVAGNLWGFN